MRDADFGFGSALKDCGILAPFLALEFRKTPCILIHGDPCKLLLKGG